MASQVIYCGACGQVMRCGSAFCPTCRHVVDESFGESTRPPAATRTAPHEQEYPA